MRMKREDLAAEQVVRAGGHRAGSGIAILHREGKRTDLKGGAHAAMLGFGHRALEDEALGAAAQCRIARLDQHFAGPGRRHRLGTQDRLAGRDIPQRAGHGVVYRLSVHCFDAAAKVSLFAHRG
jgi:hypothetical protein